MWPLKSYNLFLNVTSSEVWPDILSGDLVPENCTVTDLSFEDGCPTSDLSSLMAQGFPLVPPIDVEFADLEITLFNHQYGFQKRIMSVACSSAQKQYCSSTYQEAFLLGLNSPQILGTRQDGNSRSAFPTSSLEDIYGLAKDYYQPYTVASCIRTLVNTSSTGLLEFPLILETESEQQENQQPNIAYNLSIVQALNIPGNISQYRIGWVDLPADLFTPNKTEAILVDPAGPDSSLANVSTCTLDAGWGSSQLFQFNSEGVNFYSTMADFPPSWPKITAEEDTAGLVLQDMPDFVNISGLLFPQRRVQITESWFNFLNPQVLLGPNQTSPLMDEILSTIDQPITEPLLDRVFGLLLVDAMSRTIISTPDFELSFADNPSGSFCAECLTLQISRMAYGWAYMIDSVFIKLGIAVMFGYCLLTFGHFVFAIITGISSSAWDSVTEIIALAMNSSPTEALQNTCAEITGKRPFQTIVRIRETSVGHLELLFEEESDYKMQTSELKLNEK